MDPRSEDRVGQPPVENLESLVRAIESYRTYLTVVAGRIRNGSLQAREGTSDLVQESMLSALASIQDGRARMPGSDEREVRFWLRKILINTHRDRLRHHLAGRRTPERELRDPTIDVEADTSSPSSKAVTREEAEQVARARLALDERDRQLLTWWFEDDLSFTEIGKRLGITVTGARKACRKAAERLEAALEGVVR
jgi:RNA polymerase sigma-70 factor (ECF subfamily)